MKHRPLKKVKKSAFVLAMGLVVFALLCISFYWGLQDGHNTLLGQLHDSLYLLSKVLLLLMLPSYLLAVSLNPGKLSRRFDFIWLVDTFLEKGLHLENLCVYDRVIKSETSFHC